MKSPASCFTLILPKSLHALKLPDIYGKSAGCPLALNWWKIKAKNKKMSNNVLYINHKFLKEKFLNNGT
jgi:hypothetical protein